jgi:hypothetical protein
MTWAPEELEPVTLVLPMHEVKAIANAVYLAMHRSKVRGHKASAQQWASLYVKLKIWPEPQEVADNE